MDISPIINYKGEHIYLNADIGERGTRHPIDDQLMPLLDMANIAVTGHAGDIRSIQYYSRLAHNHRVKISAHVGYPDKENFGRTSLYVGGYKFSNGMDCFDMISEFHRQFMLIDSPYVRYVKLHGALYNDAVSNPDVAKICSEWIDRENTKSSKSQKLVNISMDGILNTNLEKMHLPTMTEFFAERAYSIIDGKLVLMPRSQEGSCMHSVEQAIEHVKYFLAWGGTVVDGKHHAINAKTICIHSDSPIALELAHAIRSVSKKELDEMRSK